MNPPGNRRNLRSYLYVPGDAGRRLDLAESRRADAVIADLEDSVALARKSDALKEVLTWLNSEQVARDTSGRVAERWVRVNAGDAGLHELDQIAHGLLRGVVLPKITSSADLAAADEVITEAERRQGLVPGAIAIMPLIETAEAVVNILPIARAPRVIMLQLGEVDLAADLGMEPGVNDEGLAAIRSNVVVSSRASGLAAPVGPVSTDYSDLQLFRASTEHLRRLGFVGRVAVHPAQLPIIHETFAPSADEVESARELIHAAKVFADAGRGAWVGIDGRMVDEAVLRQARRVLDLAATSESERK
ncbi:HpcH/HpaI aldolase/citrate lyase family protein [Cryobacterium tagatosivorans]|uniref:CoA ester lyase n=1 Tax=Cryobacterium tagatosivorans TaxID=1259199 RepID=A0A4R8UF43_9MICO|nr:CoA ester lyase [Cryobacterium tagatosivorans]TFB52450.1 CoA ester lyase [Cryobacterium tagatosivorans]